MALATSNRDGGRTSESGHLRALMKALKAQVMTGLNVTQRGAGANMSVDVQIGDAMIPRSDGTYGHPAWADAIYNVAITTADVSNPRRDIVVMYIDYGQTPSTGVSNNTNGVVKIIVVAGTPAGSPADPSNAAIQSAVGASNPFIKLARVRVAAGATSITNSVIDDLRLMAQGLLQGGWTYDDTYTWTFVSSTSFAIAGVDVTAQFPVGTKIALYQGGTIKYFVVSARVFSTNTTVTLDGRGTYTLTNVPIDKPAFSYELQPQGYPLGGVTARNTDFGVDMAAFTNGGTGGGTGFSINLGGLKILMLKGITSNAGAWKTVDWTSLGFTSIPFVAANSITQQGGGISGGWVEFTSLSSPASGSVELNGCSILTRTANATNTAVQVSLIVIGK